MSDIDRWTGEFSNGSINVGGSNSNYVLQFNSKNVRLKGIMNMLTLFKAYWSRDAPTVWHSTTVRSAHTVFMCFVFIWEQTATCATYIMNWLVFITEMKSVYSAVRTGSSNKAVSASSLKPTGHVMNHQFNIQQLYALPTLYLHVCVLYLSENKQRLVPLTA